MKSSSYSASSSAQRLQAARERQKNSDKVDELLGFERIIEGPNRLGWLITMQPCEIPLGNVSGKYQPNRSNTDDDENGGSTQSAVDCYFIQQDGSTYKVAIPHSPYFYIGVSAPEYVPEVEQFLRDKFEDVILRLTVEMKEDLDLKNHLSGVKRPFLKLQFRTVADLLQVRQFVMPIAQRNAEKAASAGLSTYSAVSSTQSLDDDVMDGLDATDSDSILSSLSFASSMTSSVSQDLEDMLAEGAGEHGSQRDSVSRAIASRRLSNPTDRIVDLREYDVPFYQRTCIDHDLRAGFWYETSFLPSSTGGGATVHIERRNEMLSRAEVRVFAFDIETSKQPLKFPDAKEDPIIMISYMVDGNGYLIINRAVVSEDIDNFEYTPKPDCPGPFTVFNEADEKELLQRFYSHIQELRPNIFVTFNGDFFDWPYIDARSRIHGISMDQEIGFFNAGDEPGDKRNKAIGGGPEYRCRYAAHLDCFKWVQRDSYLPHGSQGLKAVTKAKLGYDPLEIDPEDMVPFAKTQPQRLANYSVSDAVATYYLYMTYVHPFIFSLCNIIPMNPDDVLRKGSGTLCEALLMVQATKANVIYPNKQKESFGEFHKGHLIESQTYIGGHVEALEVGVYRSDLPVQFRLDTKIIDQLIDQLDEILRYTLRVEAKVDFDEVVNYDQVLSEIKQALELLRQTPNRSECPNIYHLDVGAMYPNIILTNRLQPTAVVGDDMCAACDFNHPDSVCQRKMQWTWRGEVFPASHAEYNQTVAQLRAETFSASSFPPGSIPPAFTPASSYPYNSSSSSSSSGSRKGGYRFDKTSKNGGSINPYSGASSSSHSSGYQARRDAANAQPVVDRKLSFDELPKDQQKRLITKRLKDYGKKVYKKNHESIMEERTATVCMRENSFYIDTVRNFRDLRYKFKDDLKDWKGRQSDAKKQESAELLKEANGMIVLYDSLQLAHKCILNSFYGYVMRKGARWFSMEMAGIVTHTGAKIIKMSRELLEACGIPLELDTDGVWTLLPKSFPENFAFKYRHPSDPHKLRQFIFSFPCVMLNARVHKFFTNDQYQDLVPVDPSNPSGPKHYVNRSECSIFFEVDGPYRAMILPASTEEGKNLKKRYAVFNNDGRLAELKGFELKRRGELKIIKIFQSQVFEAFLAGTTLEECYAAVGKIADQCLSVLTNHGAEIEEEELIELISSSSNMSRQLDDYEGQKSTAISTARRLAQFLGESIVKDKGLACQFIIAKKPNGTPVVERAIPVAIFQANDNTRRMFLRKWLKDNSLQDEDLSVRNIVDWDYYVERLSHAIQKIITIPAALQKVLNPVPRVPHPQWLQQKLDAQRYTQTSLKDLFKPSSSSSSQKAVDIEDMGTVKTNLARPTIVKKKQTQQSITSIVSSAPAPPTTTTTTSSRPKTFLEIQAEKDAEILSKPMPDEATAYADWLEYMEAKWRLMNRLRRERRQREAEEYYDQTNPTPSSRQQPPSKRIRTLPMPSLPVAQTRGPSFFGDQRRAIRTGTWEIIQIREDAKRPGLFKAWVLIGSYLHSLGVKVDREFYINASTARPELEKLVASGAAHESSSFISVKKAERSLPRSRPCGHLYQIKMSEENWLSRQKQLQQLFNQADVEGVYETQVPLVMRAILHLGCHARVTNSKPSGVDQQSTNAFGLDQLHPVLKNGQYLKMKGYDEQMRYRLVYVYIAATENRGMMALFYPQQQRAHITVIATQAAQNQNRRLLDQLDSKVFKSHFAGDEWESKFEWIESRDKVSSHLQSLLEQYRSKRPGPSILLVQSTIPLDDLQQGAVLLNDFPVVPIAPNSRDAVFAPFNWEEPTLTTCIGRFEESQGWWKQQLSLSQYSNIPVGNLQSGSLGAGSADYPIFVSDVMYSRALQQNQFLLWTSPTPQPDLGLRVQDEEAGRWPMQEEILSRSQEEKPGCYNTVSVKLSLKNLVIDSILQSQFVNDIEGIISLNSRSTSTSTFQDRSATEASKLKSAGSGIDGQSNDMTFDETFSCWKAFTVLKALVQQWVQDAGMRSAASLSSSSGSTESMTKEPTPTAFDQLMVGQKRQRVEVDKEGEGENPDHMVPGDPKTVKKLAQKQLDQCFRWLSNHSALMCDPHLRLLILQLMKKVFSHLLAHLKNLGAFVISADYHHVVLNTSKTNRAEAASYCRFISNSLRQKDVLNWIDLEPVEYSDVLLYVDPMNYGAVRSTATSTPTLQMRWAVADDLDSKIRQQFYDITGSYLTEVRRIHYSSAPSKARSSSQTLSLSQSQSQSQTPVQSLDFDEMMQMETQTETQIETVSEEEKVVKVVGQRQTIRHNGIIKDLLSKRLFSLIDDIQHDRIRLDSENGSESGEEDDEDDEDTENQRLGRRLKVLKSLKDSSDSTAQNKRSSVGLELSKRLLYVLSVDRQTTDDLFALRKQLLQFLSVGQFAIEADFRQLPAMLTGCLVSDVVCSFCCGVRNLDLLRDASLLIDADAETEEEKSGWACPSCRHLLQKDAIEQQLIETIQRKSLAYQLQDLRCQHCKQVKESNIRSECTSCSRPFRTTLSADLFQKQLHSFHKVSLLHQFDLLRDVTEWMLHPSSSQVPAT